ncbi:glycosyltransferase family 4 protein, partial [Streptomyces lancefieldiae]
LEGRVEFAGRVSDEELRQCYQSAAVFVMPSENEGFGLVYAEAMAHGVPCIGSDRDAAREVIAHGESGLCVPAGNSTALADAIVALLRSTELRSQMSRAARMRFLAHFSAEKHRDRLLVELRRWQEAAD